MPTTVPLTLENLDFSDAAEVDGFIDQVLTSGMALVRCNIAELQARGLMDGEGKLVNVELPPDMREDSDRDFGG